MKLKSHLADTITIDTYMCKGKTNKCYFQSSSKSDISRSIYAININWKYWIYRFYSNPFNQYIIKPLNITWRADVEVKLLYCLNIFILFRKGLLNVVAVNISDMCFGKLSLFSPITLLQNYKIYWKFWIFSLQSIHLKIYEPNQYYIVRIYCKLSIWKGVGSSKPIVR